MDNQNENKKSEAEVRTDAGQASTREKPNYRGKNKPKFPKKVNLPPLPYSPEVLSKPITELKLSEQTVSVLQKGGCDTVGKVAIRTAHEMYSVQFFNKKNLAELTLALKDIGVDFRPDNTAGTDASARDSDKRQQVKQQGKPRIPGDKPAPERPLDRGAVRGSFDKSGSGKNSERDKAERGRNAKPQRASREAMPEKGADDRRGYSKDKPLGGRDGSKKKQDNSFDVYRIFPRAPFVPTPPVFPAEDEFIKFQRGGKWGYKNKQGKELIPPIYDEVFAFKEDIACVERKQLFGFINRENELIIPYKYECASSFSEGLACVCLNEKCGYINAKDEIVVPFVYDAGTPFSGKTAKVKQNGRWGTYSLETSEVDWAN